jgi:hypothetical protein
MDLSGDDIKMDVRGAYGKRRSQFIELTDEEINSLKDDILAIEADVNIFVFNKGYQTGYVDVEDIITVLGDVLPDKNSNHPRDLMSSRAVLAHEYYGHRPNRNTRLHEGAWNDEFRASYLAAKNAPGLTEQDRKYLLLDAMERAKSAGVRIYLNRFMRRVIYGTDYSRIETDKG